MMFQAAAAAAELKAGIVQFVLKVARGAKGQRAMSVMRHGQRFGKLGHKNRKTVQKERALGALIMCD